MGWGGGGAQGKKATSSNEDIKGDKGGEVLWSPR